MYWKNNTIKVFILLFLSNFLSFSFLSSQNNSLNRDSIINNFNKQLALFPQEKIHLHIDRPQYISGEKIWFKAYLVDALTNRPNTPSHYIYVELINPLKEVVKRVKIRRIDNIFSGYIPVDEDICEGNYTLRAYTNYMQNLDNAYFCNKAVYISSHESKNTSIQASFDTDDNNKIKGQLRFIDVKNNKPICPKNVNLDMGAQIKTSVKCEKDSTFRFSFNYNKKNPTDIIKIEADLFKKYVQVPPKKDDFEVSFFPEGGYLLEGTACRLTFKAIKSNGNSEEITGKVFDQDGNLVDSLKTYHQGMGIIHLKTMQGKRYHAVCKNTEGLTKSFELPLPQKDAYALKITRIKDQIFVSVQHSQNSTPEEPLYLLMHIRGQLQYFEKWDNKEEFISFDKKKLPSGVMHIMLVNPMKQILSERLVFIENKSEIEIALNADKAEYTTRDLVFLNMNLNPHSNKTGNTNLSISVTDDTDVRAEENQSILTTLLLSSDIKGYIENPDFYFDEDNGKAQIALDMLMLTHGWRRYDIPSVIKGQFQEPLTAPIELGQVISGKASSVARKKPQRDCAVSIISLKNSFYDVTKTDSLGNFVFQGFEYPDSTQYIIQALTSKGSDWVELILNEDVHPTTNKIQTDNYNTEIPPPSEYIAKADQRYTLENGMRMIYLKDVEIKGDRKSIKEMTPFQRVADKSFTVEEIEEAGYYSLEDALYRVAGVTVTGGKAYIRGPISIINGNVPAAIFVDGINMRFNNDDYDLNFIHISNIERIDIHKSGASTAIFGMDGGNGVISLTLKKGGTLIQNEKFNIKRVTPLGYQKPAEFYSLRYDTKESKNDSTPDLRTTIFWKPDIKISENGKAKVEFYTADSPTNYTVIIEGITDNGNIIRHVDKITVK